MSKPSLSWVVFRKELRETLRDKRVILGVVVSPLLVTPIILAAVFFFAGKKEIEKREATLSIGLVELAPFPEFANRLDGEDNLRIKQLESRDEAIEAIEERRIRAAIIVSSNARENFLSGGSADLEIVYNFANENSQVANGRMNRFLRNFNEESVKQRVASKDLPPSFTKPTEVTSTNIATSESTGSFVLGLFLPYLIVISAAFGGIQTAFDLCAGEKERSTMETLLVSPASRVQIVKGKLVTVFVISLIAALCAITGIVGPLILGIDFMKEQIGNQISIDLGSVFGLLLIVIPLALMTSSLLLVISSFARNQKEAQAYILPFISITLLPAMLSTIFGAETQLYTAFIPILNISLTMKQILGDLFDPLFFAISLGSSLLYAFIVMRIAAALFQRETILFRT